jgi:hypothetical protein
MQATATAPPAVYVDDYHKLKLANKNASVEQIADELGISVLQAQGFENQLAKIISDAKQEVKKYQQDEIDQAENHAKFLNLGGKSRRHGKKSRRHGKKSRRHGKKSRRHAKKSRR